MGKRVIVIGAGAAGCMAAISAAKCGASVIILEKNSSVGKKILATGNGRCNFSNTDITSQKYYLDEEEPYYAAFMRELSSEACIKLFCDIGISSTEKNGMLYPYSEQAKAVSYALKRELVRLGVDIQTGVDVSSVEKASDKGFVINDSNEYLTDAVIVATGGMADPKSGSDGFGYRIAEHFGHSINSLYPALTYLTVPKNPFLRAAGDRLYARCAIYLDKKHMYEDTGQIQVTKKGLSGIPIFNLSRFAGIGIDRGQTVTVTVRLVPEYSDEELKAEINRRICGFDKSVYDAFVGLLPERFSDSFFRFIGVNPDKKCLGLTAGEQNRIFDAFLGFCIAIDGTGSFSEAQTTCGGINQSEIDENTLQSKLVKGLYFAGEILDIDGCCGGYNLHHAWASGMLSGRCAAGESDD